MNPSPAQEILAIERKLDQANKLYHNFGDSGMSDAEYDSLMDRLRQLDPDNKRLKKVGAKSDKSKTKTEKWTKFKHSDYKMGSQNKVTTKDGLVKWADRIKDSRGWIVQHKLDGTSLKLIYENGKLVTAATRGDGEIGEDITANALRMGGVPATIQDKRKIILRGEILLYKSKLHLVGGKNTRNAAAGTAKRLDGVGCEHLNVQIYDVMNWQELGFKTVKEICPFIESLGMVSVINIDCKTIDEVEEVKAEYESWRRDQQDHDLDGLVVKPNKLEPDAWDFPNRSVAYKFEAEEKVTRLLDVEWKDTGGRIAPTAILEPVDVMGVTISRATLNNVDYINKLGIKIGDLVVVSRRNDVIPCIEKVSIPGKVGKPIVPPTHDSDGFPIVHEVNAQGEQLVYLVSTNPNSLARKVRRIIAWYRAHDAKGLGEETIRDIVSADIAKDLPQFYDIGLAGDKRLMTIEGFGAGKFKILNKATLLTSKTTLVRFLEGMDMSGFSATRLEAILEHNGKKIGLMDFVNLAMDISYVSSIPQFGENTAKALHKALSECLSTIKEMVKRVSVEDWEPAKKASTKINGLSFCFTGAMAHDRKELEAMVKAHGGVVAGVSKKLDYLVISSPDWTSSKVQKADSLGIKKITETDFLNMIGRI